ncbi:MAG: hypothetical protein IIB90_16115 [Gemmatimonadetes bacterium]|nr:hypothetical protein [Gemmatimonadota bacterium]
MALTEAQIRRLAPEVRLHPRERYFPTNPIAFVRASRDRASMGLGHRPLTAGAGEEVFYP